METLPPGLPPSPQEQLQVLLVEAQKLKQDLVNKLTRFCPRAELEKQPIMVAPGGQTSLSPAGVMLRMLKMKPDEAAEVLATALAFWGVLVVIDDFSRMLQQGVMKPAFDIAPDLFRGRVN